MINYVYLAHVDVDKQDTLNLVDGRRTYGSSYKLYNNYINLIKLDTHKCDKQNSHMPSCHYMNLHGGIICNCSLKTHPLLPSSGNTIGPTKDWNHIFLGEKEKRRCKRTI